MRSILLAALCLCAFNASGQGHDPDKVNAASGVPISHRQFQLRMAPQAPVLTTPDRRFSLQSGLDHEPRPAPANARFTLHSQLRDKSTLLACGDGDSIFANGFQ